MSIVELNDEIIKIFIESKLVECDGFTLVGSYLEKSYNGYIVVFKAENRQLLLHSTNDNKDLKSINLVDMKACKCIEFSIQSYNTFKECLSEIKKNH